MDELTLPLIFEDDFKCIYYIEDGSFLKFNKQLGKYTVEDCYFNGREKIITKLK